MFSPIKWWSFDISMFQACKDVTGKPFSPCAFSPSFGKKVVATTCRSCSVVRYSSLLAAIAVILSTAVLTEILPMWSSWLTVHRWPSFISAYHVKILSASNNQKHVPRKYLLNSELANCLGYTRSSDCHNEKPTLFLIYEISDKAHTPSQRCYCKSYINLH